MVPRLSHLSLAACFAMPAFAEEMATGDELYAAIVGNTILGVLQDKTYASYYGMDGRVLTDFDSTDDSRTADIVGTWKIEGDRFCTSYSADDPICMEVRLDGDKITFFMYGMEQSTSTILRDNPHGL